MENKARIILFIMGFIIIALSVAIVVSILDLQEMVDEITESVPECTFVTEAETTEATEAVVTPPTVTQLSAENCQPLPVSAKNVYLQVWSDAMFTDDELDLACRLVYGEAGNQGYTGMVLVAQCLYNACIEYNAPPSVTRWQYGWTGGYPTYTDECREAVENVFLKGERAVDDKILFFYAPLLCEGEWHETQRFVLQYREHKFFARWE